MKNEDLHKYEKVSYTFGIFQKSTNKYNSKGKCFVLTTLTLSVPSFFFFSSDTQARGLYKTVEAAQFKFKTNQKIRFSIKSTSGTVWSSIKFSPALTNYYVPQQFM